MNKNWEYRRGDIYFYVTDKSVGRNWRDTNAVTNWIFAVRYGNIALDKIMRKLRFVFSASDD